MRTRVLAAVTRAIVCFLPCRLHRPVPQLRQHFHELRGTATPEGLRHAKVGLNELPHQLSACCEKFLCFPLVLPQNHAVVDLLQDERNARRSILIFCNSVHSADEMGHTLLARGFKGELRRCRENWGRLVHRDFMSLSVSMLISCFISRSGHHSQKYSHEYPRKIFAAGETLLRPRMNAARRVWTLSKLAFFVRLFPA